MPNTPLPPWPSFTPEEADAVQKVLLSNKVNYWTGTEGREFEKEFADYCGVKHAIVLANGTLALELALYALDIGPGDEVITTSRTFIASASCIVMRGATPIIADVDPLSQNITADTIRPLITPRTKAIIAVHLAGWPCDMDAIMALACEHNLKVIEDCAQAHGARYKGRPVGSMGDIGAFSFCQDKIMTTGGEGGMLTTNDTDLWKKAWAYKDHGKSYDAVYNREHPPGFRWLHESFGTNWRLTEMQSAIGRIQLRRLDDWVATRRRYAAMLNDAFAKIPGLRVTQPPDDVFHAYYKYYVFINPEAFTDHSNSKIQNLKLSLFRDRIMNAVVAEGIPCFSGSCSEIYREKAFADAGLGPDERLPVARELGDTSLMFLVHPTLRDVDIAKAAAAVVREVLFA
ncbi:DegT/DnrJ/EryC1/StrS family aminotransferase [Geoalkalibacter halelectricus]|uniref:DegT/DnrJ/EryC1/StrS aminotransferase family protein n=1 Tax=Geoalkalibacter halelectricus TaxID=2847045 RepID=A0ABY5ZLS8_9BACT|nr:DegT/DnrJ/EryC1/StrS aminotransferase family protein [Geoalkalibacter halelectricus]MDO3377819.1 DegT/DnrJ/EryC1/StrS aminotransferase family protein [Geoalkalibacter halelectricus]UWZ79568.1 DegT/DnrJ/EryC1/StrS aminotransferase family protein [Geoalkalibacter halelectricus]